MSILKKVPFNLNDEQIKQVETTIANMTLEEKIGQLFFLVSMTEDENYLKSVLSVNPGGIMFRSMEKEKVKKAQEFLINNTKYDLFLAANLEQGGNGVFTEGTIVGNNMLVAATNDSNSAYEQGKLCIAEASEVGSNMSFAPVSDINYNFLNPITNTRSYGDKSDTVLAMSSNYIKGIQENGGVSVMKHFPGDGVDGRDHHVVKAINNLPLDTWMRTFGKVYGENIKAGVESVMVGHIALPGYFTNDDPNRLKPASLSKELLTNLLRKELGFNGLIMTDATLMAGFMQEMPRHLAVPTAIASGNDMFLFTKNQEEDFKAMLDGYNDGILTEERLNEAVTRILGLKAKLSTKSKIAMSTEEKEQVTNNIANKAITLVKDEDKLLPLTSKKVGIIDKTNNKELVETFIAELSENGIEANVMDISTGFENPQVMMKNMMSPISSLRAEYETIIYLTNNNPVSNKVSHRVEYSGFDFPWFTSEIPTILVSFGSPYNGYDFADVPTQINSYCDSQAVIKHTVSKMLGNSSFDGVSPVSLDYKYLDVNEVEND